MTALLPPAPTACLLPSLSDQGHWAGLPALGRPSAPPGTSPGRGRLTHA